MSGQRERHGAVLADFGSTYTKVTLVDLTSAELVAHAESPTTVSTDVMDGFGRALDQALVAADGMIELGPRISASSAGGGLRVAAVGLVEDLTAAAARQAALNAGARVDLVLSGSLGVDDAEALRTAMPDIVLFCGGTDGGQRDRVLANADVVARSGIAGEAVVACNQHVAEEAAARLERAGVRTQIVENTMPRIGELNIEPARAAILDAFLTHVIHGKALSRSHEFTESVATATPEAVLRAVELLATVVGAQAGFGSVAVVDVGGATTDVHSHVAPAQSAAVGITTPQLPALPTIRTVQGDLGMRSGAGGIVAADRAWLEAELGEGFETGTEIRERQPELIPVDEDGLRLDRALATSALTHALRRHCGRQYWEFRRNLPPRPTQTGPDLRTVELLIGTGGVLSHGEHASRIIEAGLARIRDDAGLMAPGAPRIVVDRHYVLAAAGLLATHDPDLASRFMRLEFDGALVNAASAGAARSGLRR